MGKHSNIIFCDEKDQIIDSIKHVPAQMSSVREVLPGRPYFIPDTMEKQNPLTAAGEDFSRALRGKPMRISKAVYTSFTGISPVVAEEICYLAGIDSQMTASDLTDDMLTICTVSFNIIWKMSETAPLTRSFISTGIPRRSFPHCR